MILTFSITRLKSLYTQFLMRLSAYSEAHATQPSSTLLSPAQYHKYDNKDATNHNIKSIIAYISRL